MRTLLSILSLTSVNLNLFSLIKLIDWLLCNQVGYKQSTEIIEKACNFIHPSDRNYSSEVNNNYDQTTPGVALAVFALDRDAPPGLPGLSIVS